MGHREELSSMFDYDRWANLQWMPIAGIMSQQNILLHILTAQIRWLSRAEGIPEWQPSPTDYAMNLDRSIRSWKRFILGADLSRNINYTMSDGADGNNTVSEIVRHVINHGTYHRGQLRGMAEAQSFDFPETDYIGFLRDNAGLSHMRYAAVVEAIPEATVT
jgi:uncharacterized damage-inducible protein DinB